MKATNLTIWQEIQLWWALQGELQFDLATYYAICCVVGLVEGAYIGCRMIGMLP